MPGIFHQPVNRRKFLGSSAKALALLALARRTVAVGQEAPEAAKPVRMALLSDTHVPADSKNEYRKFLPWENLKTVVPQVIESRPEGVILNGDAARLTGELADYEAVKQLLAPLAERAPVYIGLGNHDDRDNFFKVVHHTLGDGDGELLDVERLFQLTRLHKTVKAIIYGHSHKYVFSQEDGIHLINIPAVGYNFSDDEPVGWVDAVFAAKGVDLKLRAFAGNRAADGKSRSLTWRC